MRALWRRKSDGKCFVSSTPTVDSVGKNWTDFEKKAARDLFGMFGGFVKGHEQEIDRTIFARLEERMRAAGFELCR
jgi:hypothetical protein